MQDFIIAVVLAVLIIAAMVYLHRQKKKGRTCIGCPCASQCSGGHCGEMSDKKQ